MRVKADTDVQVLAGNSGINGAVLLESKAPAAYNYKNHLGDDVQAGGIQLKAASGSVVAWAKEIYLRTGGGNVAHGDIVIDAGRGTNTISTYSQNFTRYIASQATDSFGLEGVITGNNIYSSSQTALTGNISINGHVDIVNGLNVRDDVVIDRGHIFTQNAAANGFQVSPLKGAALISTESTLDGIGSDAKITIQQAKTAWTKNFKQYWYGTQGPGNNDVISSVGFSFRSVDNYKTKNFKIYDAPWQQAARMTNNIPSVWVENPVMVGSTPTFPYPGKENYLDNKVLLEQPLTLYDPTLGISKSRDSKEYINPAFKTSIPHSLDDYIVIL